MTTQQYQQASAHFLVQTVVVMLDVWPGTPILPKSAFSGRRNSM